MEIIMMTMMVKMMKVMMITKAMAEENNPTSTAGRHPSPENKLTG